MNRQPFFLESLQVTDIDDLMVIEHEAFSAPWSASMYRYEITRNELGHYLALRFQANGSETGLLLGYAGFWLLVDEAHISTIAMRSGWRGHGLGEWLLLGLLQKAIEVQAVEATLEVRVSNIAAQGLYRKLGFEVVGRRKRYYSDNGEDALLMTLSSLQDRRIRAALVAEQDATVARLEDLATRITSGDSGGLVLQQRVQSP
jgi:[ribosomal protein S18]-alanine N-acetyltransferase